MNQQELGIYGETLAKNYLIEKGYEVIQCNYRFRKLELDLVCSIDNLLVIVEVKTRFTDEFGEPWKAVTKAKQKQLIKAANFYIEEFDVHQHTRFDVISIVHNDKYSRLEHIIDAFTP